MNTSTLRWWRWWGAAAGLLLVLAAPVRAAGELDGEFVVRSATAAFSQGVVALDADVQFPMTERISEALRGGVTLAFELEINIQRPRRFWFDSEVIGLLVRRELAYHVISDRFIVRDMQGNEQSTYATLQAALDHLGHLSNFPIAIEAQMRGRGPWAVGLRAGVRRGRIPDALRVIMFWSDDWHRTSDWYSWTLER
jgi:hypothetical protein